MSPTIRPATPTDIAAITRIYAHAVGTGTASFELTPPDEAEMTRRMQALHAKDMPYFVAEMEDVVAGYAYAGPFRERPAYRFTLEDSIYVAPAMQGRGIGRTLLATLIATAEAKGFRQMIGVIGDSENAGSIALHAAQGFQYVGTLPNTGYKFGRWLDTVLMQRPLGPGASTMPED